MTPKNLKPLAALVTRSLRLRVTGSRVTSHWHDASQLGPGSELGRLEKKGANVTRPRDQETANRYYENDGASSLVHELAFGIVICFVTRGQVGTTH